MLFLMADSKYPSTPSKNIFRIVSPIKRDEHKPVISDKDTHKRGNSIRRKRPNENEQELVKKRNRKAARVSRLKKKENEEKLRLDVKYFAAENTKKINEIKKLRLERDYYLEEIAIAELAIRLSEDKRGDRDTALAPELEELEEIEEIEEIEELEDADFQGASCGADSTRASSYSPITFPPDSTATEATYELQDLGYPTDFLSHADEPVEGSNVDPILAQVSLTLRQVNCELAKSGFIPEIDTSHYDIGYIQSVFQNVMAPPPWTLLHDKKDVPTMTRKIPSHVDPTVVLPEKTKY